MVVEIRRRRLQDAKTVCVIDMWSHASVGRVSRRGFARRACCCCLLLLLLVAAAAPGAAVTRGYTHALQMMYPSVSPARGNVVSSGQEVWSTPLSGQAWPIQSVRRVTGQQNTAVESHHSYHNMLRKYDEVAYIYENLLRLCDQPLVTGE